MKEYIASATRYAAANDIYRRCGNSGILLPKVSLGFWQNFGAGASYDDTRAITRLAFDNGITHFDLANNYGPPPGAAEELLGRMLKEDFAAHRDELFIATKAGYDMWQGPYGSWGSRKHLIASLDQSLARMQLDYTDLFYIHRYDPETPLDETLQTLVDIVRAGKALYIGISRWPLEALKYANDFLRKQGVPPLIFQSGIFLDKENCNYLTENENEVFKIMRLFSSNYKNEKEKATTENARLSPCVGMRRLERPTPTSRT